MLKLFVAVLAAAALAAPAAAFAHDGQGHTFGEAHVRANLASLRLGVRLGWWMHGTQFAKLSGTGTSFGSDSATASGTVVGGNLASSGTAFSATLATTWSSAQSKTWVDNDGDNDDGTVTVSCAPATASVTIGSSSAETLTGKTCSWTRNGTTLYGFGGVASNGDRIGLKEDGTSVEGAAISGGGGGVHPFFRFGHRR